MFFDFFVYVTGVSYVLKTDDGTEAYRFDLCFPEIPDDPITSKKCVAVFYGYTGNDGQAKILNNDYVVVTGIINTIVEDDGSTSVLITNATYEIKPNPN